MEKDIIYREYIIVSGGNGTFDIAELNGDLVDGALKSQSSAKQYINDLIDEG